MLYTFLQNYLKLLSGSLVGEAFPFLLVDVFGELLVLEFGEESWMLRLIFALPG